jgi:hypothetical protein
MPMVEIKPMNALGGHGNALHFAFDGVLHASFIAYPQRTVMSSKITILKMTRDMDRSWPTMAVIMEQDNIHHAR